MHEFSSNKSYRKTVLVIITILSLIINCLLVPFCDIIAELIFNNIGSKYYPFIILFGVGFSGIFGLIYFIFNHWVWKILPVIKSQNISGEYECKGFSSYKNIEWEGNVIINQTWSRIAVKLETGVSASKSFMADIEVDDDGIITLRYCYNNNPNGELKGLHKHEGTAELNFTDSHIRGKYYNYPIDHARYGTLKLIKKEK